VDSLKGAVLLWKPFSDDAAPPRWIRPKKKPVKEEGKVTVTAFKNGWCPAQNMVFERAKRAASEFGDKVIFREVDTFDRNTLLEWGIPDSIFVDDKQITKGPPLSYEKIKKKIAKKVKKLK
jgi:thiol-disulfide isomerase/thioredoxin